jgi:hypothetical protein
VQSGSSNVQFCGALINFFQLLALYCRSISDYLFISHKSELIISSFGAQAPIEKTGNILTLFFKGKKSLEYFLLAPFNIFQFSLASKLLKILTKLFGALNI